MVVAGTRQSKRKHSWPLEGLGSEATQHHPASFFTEEKNLYLQQGSTTSHHKIGGRGGAGIGNRLHLLVRAIAKPMAKGLDNRKGKELKLSLRSATGAF